MSVRLGAAGAVESSVYAKAAEQAETLPTPSVAVARRLVVASPGTGVVIPAPPKVVALPVASGAPEQSDVE